MTRDDERRRRTGEAVGQAGLSAVACALPSNVLLLTGGYWPVIGTSVAVAAADGRVAVVVPEDEAGEVEAGFADVVRTFRPGSLDDLKTAAEAVVPALAEAVAALGIPQAGRWGYEHAADTLPHSYVAMHLYRLSLRRLLKAAAPGARLAAADGLLRSLRSNCTPAEIDRVRRACDVARGAFLNARFTLSPGRTEVAVAAVARAALAEGGDGRDDGMMWVMSGSRSAQASGAFARSSPAKLVAGELALVHCNNQVGGYWTDVTRTFCLGRPSDEQRRMYDAVFAARAAALATIRPGARAADVDGAARAVLVNRGFGPQFKHGLGHGVPFAAIAPNERPRLHPRSPDVLTLGNVFNVEPAIYFAGQQGMRHCDVVAVTEGGADVLTPWLCEAEETWL